MDRNIDIVELSATQLDQVSGGTGVNLINAQLATTVAESVKGGKDANRKAGKGQQEYLIVTLKEVFVT